MNLDSLAQELDRLYQFEISEYISRCDELKKSGLKIYRNSNGEHKVVMAGQQSGSSSESSSQQYVYRNTKQPEHYGNENKKENIFVRIKNRVARGVQTFKSIIRFIRFISSPNRNR